MQIAIARIKTKLRMLPTPKYISSKNKVNDIEAISPRREFAKRREKVNSRLEKNKIKKTGTAPKLSGSIK